MNQGSPASETHEAPHDEKSREVEIIISDLLRIGVSISLTLVVIGAVLSYVHHPSYIAEHPVLQELIAPGVKFPHSLAEVWHGLRQFKGQAVITLGLILLIATPVFRVAVSIFGFVYEHDRKYVIITSLVLALLILSFVIGKVE